MGEIKALVTENERMRELVEMMKSERDNLRSFCIHRSITSRHDGLRQAADIAADHECDLPTEECSCSTCIADDILSLVKEPTHAS